MVKMMKIGVLGAVVVILALMMFVASLTATVVIKTPKYGPTCEDLPTYTNYTYVKYARCTEDELNEIRDRTGINSVYIEMGDFYVKKPQLHKPHVDQGEVIIYEFTNDIAAKKAYEVIYEKSISDWNPVGVDIGDEGASCNQKRILFRTGRFVVYFRMYYFGEDIARITEQNIGKATASPTPGFGAIFAIAGLLIVFYLIRRNR